MTVLLPVDAAHGFDCLAILKVKADHGMDVGMERERIEYMMLMQLGQLFEQIIKSNEFADCCSANAEVFDAIEKAHRNLISAKDVQVLNHRRFEAKTKLQNRFWPGSVLMEKKTLIDRDELGTIHHLGTQG